MAPRLEDDDDPEYDDDGEHSPVSDLGFWLEEACLADPRFETVDLREGGVLEGEAFRVCMNVTPESHFFVSVLPNEMIVRIGLSTENVKLSEAIEKTIENEADSMTEYLLSAMSDRDELEHEMQHFHDDAYYFCSEIPYDSDAQLGTEEMREEIMEYLDGYVVALVELLSEAD